MSYERQYYTNGDVLEASHLNHMETGIKENSDNIDKLSEEKVDKPRFAVVGQLLAVKSVDENGNPTEFEAVDKLVASGAVTEEELQTAVKNFLVNNPISGTISSMASNALLTLLYNAVYKSENMMEQYEILRAQLEASIVKTTTVSLSENSLEFTTSDAILLTATRLPETSTEPLIWESSNEEVAIVNNGLVTPVSNGSCVITVFSGNASSTCNVTVAIAGEEDNINWTYSWDYSDGMPDNNGYTVTNNNATSELLSDGLELKTTEAGGYCLYALNDKTKTSGDAMCEFVAKVITPTSNDGQHGFRAMIANTANKNCQVYFGCNGGLYYDSGKKEKICDLEANTEYRVRIVSNITNSKNEVYLNGELVHESTSMSTISVSSNRFGIQNPCDIVVKSVKWKFD